MKLCLVALATVVLCIGCPTPSPQPPPNDADATPQVSEAGAMCTASPTAIAVCANLEVLGCEEAPSKHPDCRCVIEHVLSSKPKIRPFDAECLLVAMTKEAARACKSGVCVK